jgi:hypothetical protein
LATPEAKPPAAAAATTAATAAAPAAATPRGAGARAGLDYGKWDRLAREQEDEPELEYFEREWYDAAVAKDRAAAAAGPAPAAARARPPAAAPPAAATAGVTARDERMVERGGIETGYLWSQDATQVTVSIPVPAGISAKGVRVTLGAHDRVLRVALATGVGKPEEVLLERSLWQDVWGAVVTQAPALGVEADIEEDRAMDWELRDLPPRWAQATGCPRCVAVSLRKHLPAEHLLRSLWWPRCFAGGAERDLDVRAWVQPGLGDTWAAAQAMFLQHQREARAAADDGADDEAS